MDHLERTGITWREPGSLANHPWSKLKSINRALCLNLKTTTHNYKCHTSLILLRAGKENLLDERICELL